MSALHDWHRQVFTKRTPTTLVFPAYSTIFGGNFPEVRNEVTLNTARTVVCQRVVNALTPAEWKHAQAAFDASPAGRALTDKDPGVRHEHCELWLLHSLHESDHPDLVPVTELALQVVLAEHTKSHKLAAHKARLVAFLTDGEQLHAEAPVAEEEVSS